ncbi:MAG TPA: hypothetical protein VKZ94_17595 [Advenella sp.]|nr:hypothetical protein [Advenella sp.]
MAKPHSYESYKHDMEVMGTNNARANLDYEERILTPGFLSYFNNPASIANYAEALILDNAVDISARVMASLSIQKLPQDRLFKVQEKVVHAALEGKLDRRQSGILGYTILGAILFPDPGLNAFLNLYYDEPRSRKLLTEALGIPDLEPELLEQIEMAQSGKGRENYLNLLDLEQPLRTHYKLDGRDLNVMDE